MPQGRAGLAAACLMSLVGCAGVAFTESDQGTLKEVERGAEFSVSLPASASARPTDPQMKGTILRLVDSRRNENRDVYTFQAEGLGETELRIPGPKGKEPRDFVIRVRVKSGSDDYKVPMRQH